MKQFLLPFLLMALLVVSAFAQTPTPTASPSSSPTASPTASPSASPTATPTASPTASPTPRVMTSGPTSLPIAAIYGGDSLTDENDTLDPGETMQIALVPGLASTATLLNTMIEKNNAWITISLIPATGEESGLALFLASVQWKFFDGAQATPSDFLDGSEPTKCGMPYRATWQPYAIRVRGIYLDVYNDSISTVTVQVNRLNF